MKTCVLWALPSRTTVSSLGWPGPAWDVRAGWWRHSTGLMCSPTQSFLAAFRSLAMVEKSVEKCCISLNGRSSRLVVQLHCRYGEWAAGRPWGPCVWRGGRAGQQDPLRPCLPIQG